MSGDRESNRYVRANEFMMHNTMQRESTAAGIMKFSSASPRVVEVIPLVCT
jgi:hypothetical protein